MNDYGWLFRPRNKNIGVGWQTYYQAMSNVWVNACIQTYIDEIINLGFTIYNPDLDHMHKDIINFLLDAQSINCKLCLWTANSTKIPFILDKCKEVGLIFDYINESPIKIEEGIRKPHFNILLDDVAGLSQTLEILVNVLSEIKDTKCNLNPHSK